MNAVEVLRPGGRVTVVAPPPVRVAAVGTGRAVTVTATRTDVVRVSTPGPQGPPGRDGAGTPGPAGPPAGYVVPQTSPAGTWTFPNPTGRLPNLATYVDGARVYPDEHADASTVTLVFAVPTGPGYTVVT